MTVETEPILAGLRGMIAEEMHLLSQELDADRTTRPSMPGG